MVLNPQQTFMEHHDLARQALERLDSDTATRHLDVARRPYDEIQRQAMFGFGKKELFSYHVTGEEEAQPDYHGMLIELREDCDHQRNLELRAAYRRGGGSERGIDIMTSRERGLNEIIRFLDGDPRPQDLPDVELDASVLVRQGDSYVKGTVERVKYDSASKAWQYDVRIANESVRVTKNDLVKDVPVRI